MTPKELADALLALLPEHAASLTIEHNEHLCYYATAAEEFMDRADIFPTTAEWEKAIDTNEVWVLRWYPRTPVGFCTIGASSLEKLLETAAAMK